MAPKRSFYEDEELITTKPGYNSEISKELKEKESAHGNISFIEGMGVRTTPYLEKHFNSLRSYLHDKFSIAAAELGTQRTAVANEWSTFKNKVDEVILEPVIPDCVNVIFPVLITSVAVGRRSLPVRFLATSAAFGLSVKYYMPRTYGAAKSKLLSWEKENYPDLWKKQQELGEQTRDLVAETNNLRAQSKQDLQKQIHEVRLWVAKLLED